MEGKPVSIRVNGSWHRIRPVERMLCLGGRAFSLKQVVHRKGGLIIGEGDTGKSTYAGLLAQALEQGGAKPVFVKLRSRPKLELPEVPEGETQTIIWDGLDEYPECAREIIDLTDGLDPNRYHVWKTSITLVRLPTTTCWPSPIPSDLTDASSLSKFAGRISNRSSASPAGR